MITGKYPSLRLRRNRKNSWSRRLVSENNLSPNDFILPIFLIEGKNKTQPIKSMPGVYRYSINRLGIILDRAIKNQIPMVALFPYISFKLKDDLGSEAINENNLVCKAIKYIKKRYKNKIGIMCDVALDPYTKHGHDGILKSNNIMNDETIEILIQQSLLQAQMGCDVLAPSDMMDGRIGKIRKALDKENFKNTQILSYAVKYASNFYGPFRDAVGSKVALKGDKKTYQMDFRNYDEAIREVALDIKEGADMIMVKPAISYLDIIAEARNITDLPIAAYHVSGEYAMIKAAASQNLIDGDVVALEQLTAIKRAGADFILTYLTREIAETL